VLADPSIDAIALATPRYGTTKWPRLRWMQEGRVGREAARRRRQTGEHLVRLAKANQRILMVGHILRYHPAILKLQKLIQDGALGKIDYVYSNRLNIGKIRTEENILWSFAPTIFP